MLCVGMGGHGYAHVMLWVGMDGHRSLLMDMVLVWVQFKGKCWALLHARQGLFHNITHVDLPII